ncbi:hypothetical protein HPP92_004863 [Vanilla planifolia]|uniref:Uncharacterized protein n=1 Tax=Vanilla planifolia TaxID=51239 RepID=A0A835RFR1_VANPL|nr:hypothetical protein HPP92_004863 [Vanilla planifolia]
MEEEDQLRLIYGNFGEEATQMGGQDQEDFEFAFSIESDPGTLPEITADEIFHNGRILPVYPVFNRNLVSGCHGVSCEQDEGKVAEEMGSLTLGFEKRDLRSGSASSSSSISSEAEDLERRKASRPAQFVRAPTSAPQSPDRWGKSSSTGSSGSASRKWKLRDLVVGRSRSDGKERFVVLRHPEDEDKRKNPVGSAKPNTKAPADLVGVAEKKGKAGKGKGEGVKEMDIVTAHRIYYGKIAVGGSGSGSGSGSGGGQVTSSGGTRRSFLPYKQELLGGLFANAKHHPF